MNNLFEIAAICLYSAKIEEKLSLTHHARLLSQQKQLDFSHDLLVQSINDVQFPDKPILLAPRQMPKRKLTTLEGVIAFFHAIAHVEFMAIYLAWDLIYRFRDLPQAFYQDWLCVADEEAQHFELIRQHLRSFNVDYGDLPAHGGLWSHATETANDLLARLALVPRCMEARGLDVTPAIIAKFTELGDTAGVAILNRILTDEIKHVERGSYWFKTYCDAQNLDSVKHYQTLLGQYYTGGKPKGPFNGEIRIAAGFTQEELDWLEEK